MNRRQFLASAAVPFLRHPPRRTGQWVEVRPQLLDGLRGGPVAFLPKSLPIVPGSVNLLPSRDKVPEQDCLELTNWQPDRIGALIARRGHYNVLSRPETKTFRAIAVASEPFPQYYGQIDTSLVRGGAGSPGVFLAGATDIVSFVCMQGFMFIMSQQIQKKDTGSGTPKAWTPAAPTAAATYSTGAGGGLTGSRDYYVTGVTAAGEETNPSPVLTITGLSSNTVTITRPTFADSQVTQWNLYRSGGSLQSGALKVNSDPVALATTTYLDEGTEASGERDEDLERRGEILEADHDVVPACAGAAGPYYERILMWNSAGHKNRLYWTPTSQPCYVRGPETDEGDWVDVGDFSEAILAVVVRPRMVTIYKEASIWKLTGDPDDGDLQMVIQGVGLVGRNAVVNGGDSDYFQWREGVYSFNGDGVRKISHQLDPIFRDESVQTGSDKTYWPLHSDHRDDAAIGHVNGRLYFSYRDSHQFPDYDNNNCTFVCDLATGRWAGRGLQDGYGCFLYDGQRGDFLAGSVGTVRALEKGYGDSGGSIYLAFQSRFFDMGLPENKKTWADLEIEAETGGAALEVRAYYDNGFGGRGYDVLGSIASTYRKVFILRFGDGLSQVQTRNISIRITGNAPTDATVLIHRMMLHYYVEARRARVFDSGITDLGDPRVKVIDDVEFDIDAPSDCRVRIETALPDMEMGRAWEGLIAGGSGRRPVRLGVGPDILPEIAGKLLRIVVTTDASEFAMYGCRVHVRGIGVYLLGSVGEKWTTAEMPVGV